MILFQMLLRARTVSIFCSQTAKKLDVLASLMAFQRCGKFVGLS